MRALGQRAAQQCETAKTPRCICRCGGVLHGANRQVQQGVREALEFLVALPEEDPHFVTRKTWQPRLPAPIGWPE